MAGNPDKDKCVKKIEPRKRSAKICLLSHLIWQPWTKKMEKEAAVGGGKQYFVTRQLSGWRIVPGKSLSIGIKSGSTHLTFFLGVSPTPESFDSGYLNLGVVQN